MTRPATVLVAALWLGVMVAAVYCGVQFAHVDQRISRIETRVLVCHPIVGEPTHRVCRAEP